MNNPSAFPGFQFTEGHGPNRRVADPAGGDSVWEEHAPGMTLRDYFAAAALPGLLIRRWEDDTGKVPGNVHTLWANAAYLLADEMLKAREPQGERSK